MRKAPVFCGILMVLLLAPALAPAQAGEERAQLASGTASSGEPARPPVRIGITVPAQRPSISTRGLLVQTGAGIVGGIGGALAVGIPFLMSGRASGPSDDVALVLMLGAYTGGVTAGVHYAGRAQGMRANPLATVGGVLGGLVLGGAAMQPFMDDEGNVEGPTPMLVFVLPAVGGTAGYALTRRFR